MCKGLFKKNLAHSPKSINVYCYCFMVLDSINIEYTGV